MISRPRWTKTTFMIGGAAAWGLLLISCVMVDRTVVAPPQIAGATFVGTKECTQCHEEQTGHFATATHAKLAIADSKVGNTGCEACHGPGSIHVKAGGGKGTIINPKKSPESCFQCHLDKRGEFALPNAHQVLNGKMTCGDCHDPHEGNAIKGAGAATLEGETETCTKCHTTQKGPFIFKHNAIKEGCTACHSPHGSVNQKMLVARDNNLCLRCHFQVSGPNLLMAGGEDHRSRMQNGTCWGQGCHEAVHGSQVNKALRY